MPVTAPSAPPVTFHILYVPGTVHLLGFLVFSLLRQTTAYYRLVANGLDADEAGELEQLSAQDDRLTLITLPNTAPIAHGSALNTLQQMTNDRFFCFMDSDMFATGDFVADLRPHLGKAAALYSGAPLWALAKETVFPEDCHMISGRYLRTDQGLALGGSYFAVYDNETLTRLRSQFWPGFEKCNWSQIPPEYQEQFAALHLRRKRYDTAKALNLILTAANQPPRYVELTGLHHLGGISSLNSIRTANNWLQRLARHLPPGYTQRVLNTTGISWRKARRHRLGATTTWRQWRYRLKQERIALYFRELLGALHDGHRVPGVPRFLNRHARNRLRAATRELIRFRESLS